MVCKLLWILFRPKNPECIPNIQCKMINRPLIYLTLPHLIHIQYSLKKSNICVWWIYFPFKHMLYQSLGVLLVPLWYFDHWIIEHQQKVKLANHSKLISPSAAYMHQWFRSALVQIMACHLFGAKPLSKPMFKRKLNWNLHQNTKFFIHENAS